MLKKEIEVRTNKGLNYVYLNGKKTHYTPWLGDVFSSFYDSIMEKSIFPKKFEASIDIHNHFLKKELQNIHDKKVLEVATGSGNVSEYLPRDNKYAGIDISKGLLHSAFRKFKKNSFNEFTLFLCSAEELPFQDTIFDICICNLSFNFFENITTVIKEIQRVLKNNGILICSVPVPERNTKQSTIRGNLYSERELKELFENAGLSFHPYEYKNGTLLYFKAIKGDSV